MDEQKPKRRAQGTGSASKAPPEVSAAAGTLLPIISNIVIIVGSPLLQSRPDHEDIRWFTNRSWRVEGQLLRIKLGLNPGGTETLQEKLGTIEQWVRKHPDIFKERTDSIADSLHAAAEEGIAAGLYVAPEKPGKSGKSRQSSWIPGF